MNEKKIVHYDAVEAAVIRVGIRAVVYPIDHPDLSNRRMALTSVVLSYDETTEIFETEHSIYVPAGPKKSVDILEGLPV